MIIDSVFRYLNKNTNNYNTSHYVHVYVNKHSLSSCICSREIVSTDKLNTFVSKHLNNTTAKVLGVSNYI